MTYNFTILNNNFIIYLPSNEYNFFFSIDNYYFSDYSILIYFTKAKLK